MNGGWEKKIGGKFAVTNQLFSQQSHHYPSFQILMTEFPTGMVCLTNLLEASLEEKAMNKGVFVLI